MYLNKYLKYKTKTKYLTLRTLVFNQSYNVPISDYERETFNFRGITKGIKHTDDEIINYYSTDEMCEFETFGYTVPSNCQIIKCSDKYYTIEDYKSNANSLYLSGTFKEIEGLTFKNDFKTIIYSDIKNTSDIGITDYSDNLLPLYDNISNPDKKISYIYRNASNVKLIELSNIKNIIIDITGLPKWESIKKVNIKNTILPPVQVKLTPDGKYEIYNGFHRTKLSCVYKFTCIPAIISH